MSYNPKIVSFERNAAYLHTRGMKNLRENKLLDALELMRAAVSQEPENARYRLDLADLYCRLGYHELSRRIILDLMSEGGEVGECSFYLALNRLACQDMEGAKRALELYRDSCGESEFSARVESIDEALVRDFLAGLRGDDRKAERQERLCERAYKALNEGQPEAARRMLRRADARGGLGSTARICLALSEKLCGDDKAARKEYAEAGEPDSHDPKQLCALMQLLELLGEHKAADKALEKLIGSSPDGLTRTVAIGALVKSGRFEEAERLTAEALRVGPYDRNYLHMNAVLKLRGSGDREAAIGCWQRILRIDPEDSIALYYYNSALDGGLDPEDLPLLYQLPLEEYNRRLDLLAEKLLSGIDSAVEAWRGDEDFRRCVLWTAGLNELSCAQAAVMVLVMANDASADSALRELMDRHGVNYVLKAHILRLMRSCGRDVKTVLPPDVNDIDGLLPDAEDILCHMPACERQLVRFAAEIVETDFHHSALAALAMHWNTFRMFETDRAKIAVSTQEAAAALAWNYLLTRDVHIKPVQIIKSFECKPRRMLYYAKHIASVMAKGLGERK